MNLPPQTLPYFVKIIVGPPPLILQGTPTCPTAGLAIRMKVVSTSTLLLPLSDRAGVGLTLAQASFNFTPTKNTKFYGGD